MVAIAERIDAARVQVVEADDRRLTARGANSIEAINHVIARTAWRGRGVSLPLGGKYAGLKAASPEGDAPISMRGAGVGKRGLGGRRSHHGGLGILEGLPVELHSGPWFLSCELGMLAKLGSAESDAMVSPVLRHADSWSCLTDLCAEP